MTWGSPKGQPEGLCALQLMLPVSVPTERGAIGSIELDGSHFRLVREGLHGLSLFAIGDGFLLWTTALTNGEPSWDALSFLQLLRLPWDSGSPPVPGGYRVKGRLQEPHLLCQAPLWEEVERC